MYVNIKKVKDPDMVIEEFKDRYGTINSLSQRVSISKCTTKNEMEDLMVWKYLKSGAVLEEEIVLHNSDIFDTLTPKRMELVDYLTKNKVASIRKLSEAVHRNYKNTYDDLLALEKMGLVEFKRSGKSRIPTSFVVGLETTFER